MGERSQKVIVRAGNVIAFTERWGAHTCYRELLDGADVIQTAADDFAGQDNRWYEDYLVEGGYLVDFDQHKILVYSWGRIAMEEDLPKLSAAWPGWEINPVADAPEGFITYLESRGIRRPVPIDFLGELQKLINSYYQQHCDTVTSNEALMRSEMAAEKICEQAVQKCSWWPGPLEKTPTAHPTLDIQSLHDPEKIDAMILKGIEVLRDKPVFNWLEPTIHAGVVPSDLLNAQKTTLGFILAIAITGELKDLYEE